MTAPKSPRHGARLSTEALLQLVAGVAARLSRLSRDPGVRREAVNVGQAVSRLLTAIRQSGTATPPNTPSDRPRAD
ncbi:MAG: hypothetical protein ACR2J4_03390 [Deinococcus sp.]